jgi:very-short-patch-repair endonuclease
LHNEHKAILINGRHNRAAGFNADLEKYLEASLAGWRVFRFGPDQITMENVERLVRVIQAPACPAFHASAINAESVCSEI